MAARLRRRASWPRSAFVCLVTVACLLVATTCGLDKLVRAPESKPAVEFAVGGDSVVILGGTISLAVTVAGGAVSPIARVIWSSANPAIATVDTTGNVTGVVIGVVQITARLVAPQLDTGIVRTTTIRVRYQGIVLTPVDSITSIGDSKALVARGTNAAGVPQAIVAPTAFVSRDTLTATVTSTGVVTARRNGATYVVAGYDGGSDSVLVRVRQVATHLTFIGTEIVVGSLGTDRTIVVTALDNNNNAIPLPAVTWAAANPAVAVIDAATGVLRALVADTTTITATVDAATQSITMRVAQVVVALNKAAGDAQTATVGTAVPTPPRVLAVDSGGFAVAGAGVTFTVARGGGTVAGGNQSTDANGVAAVAAWTVGAVADTNVLIASSASANTSFLAAATAGSPVRLSFVVQPTSTAPGIPIAAAVRIAIVDSAGNVVSTATNVVSVAIGANPGGAALGGTLSVAAVAGLAIFPNLTLSAVGQGYTLVAFSGALGVATSNSFNMVSVPARLAFLTQPSDVGVTRIINPAVRVAVQDAAGNTVASATSTITMVVTTNPGSALLGGTTSSAAVNGVATFPDLTLSAVGTAYQLGATATGLPLATSAAFNVSTAGSAAQLAFQVQPANAVAGAAIAPAIKVLVQDANGVTVDTAARPVTLTIDVASNSGNSTLGGAASVMVNAVNGVATFNSVSLNHSGIAYKLVAAATGVTGATSTPFNITPGTPTTLAFSAQPSNVVTGATLAPVIQVVEQDALGNTVTAAADSVGVAITSGTGTTGAVLGGTLKVKASGGIATFSTLTVSTAGTAYTLTASSIGLASSVSASFNVTASTAPFKVAFITQPSNETSGSVIAPAIRVAVQDASGNTLNTASATIRLDLGANPSGTALGGTVSATTSSGIATFNDIAIPAAGSGYTLVASSSGLSAATSSSFDVTFGDAAKLAFSTSPGNVVAGTSFPSAIQASILDRNGNLVKSATNVVSIAFGQNPGGGTLLGSTAVAAASGVATFTGMRIQRSGTGYTLVASTSGGIITPATTAAFDVVPAPASALAFKVQPSAVVSGVAESPAIQVQVVDSLGNAISSATNVVAVSIASGTSGATLSGTRSATASTGVATFNTLMLDKAGSYTFGATATNLASATSNTFAVSAGPAARYFVTTSSSSPVSGSAVTITAQLADASGNSVSASGRTVTWSKTGSGGSFASPTSATDAFGVATVGFTTGTTVGTSYTVTATDNTALTGTAAAMTTVAPGSPARYLVTPSDTAPVAGSGVTITAQVVDGSGNAVASSGRLVTWSKTGTGGTFASATSTTNAGGVATVTFTTSVVAGVTYTMTGTDNATLTGTSGSVSTVPGAASTATSTVTPSESSITADGTSSSLITVQLKDANGNNLTASGGTVLVTTSAGAISTTTNSQNGTYAATLTASTAADTATVGATLGGTNLASSTTVAFVAGAAAQYTVTSNGASPVAGTDIIIGAQLTDENGNAVATSGKTITWSKSGAGGSFASSTSTTNASGIAAVTFTTSTTAGTVSTFTATDNTSLSGTSGTVTTIAGTATQYVVTPSNPAPVAGSAVTISAQLADANGNAVATSGKTVTWSKSGGQGSFSPATSTTNVSGVATVSFTTGSSAANYVVKVQDNTSLSGSAPVNTVAAGTATRYLVSLGNSSPVAGTAITVTAQLADANGTAVSTSGKTVTWTKTGTGGSFSSTTSTTNSSGIASVTFTTDASLTTYTVTATDNTSLTGTSASFTTIGAAAARGTP